MTSNQTWVVVWTVDEDCPVGRIPRPYCREAGPSALAVTMARAQKLTDEKRIVAVVKEKYDPWWKKTLADVPAENVAVEPLDRGTATSVLLGVIRVFRRDPTASVVLMSTDAADEPEQRMLAKIEAGLEEVRADEDRLCLYQRDGTIQSSLVVASASALIQLFMQSCPVLLQTFLRHLAGRAAAAALETLDSFYPFLPVADFCGKVLRECTRVQSGLRWRPVLPRDDLEHPLVGVGEREAYSVA